MNLKEKSFGRVPRYSIYEGNVRPCTGLENFFMYYGSQIPEEEKEIYEMGLQLHTEYRDRDVRQRILDNIQKSENNRPKPAQRVSQIIINSTINALNERLDKQAER